MGRPAGPSRKGATSRPQADVAHEGTSLADALFTATQQRVLAFAAIYGSIAKHKETAASDIDLLIVSDELTLEQLFTALLNVEEDLSRTINPTLYTSEEFERRKKKGNSFLARVLDGEHVVLIGDEDGPTGTGKSGPR